MNKKKLSIRWKITILSYILVIFSFLIGGIVLIGNIIVFASRGYQPDV